MSKYTGTVYLIHFDQALAHAMHYLGYTKNLEERLQLHRAGRGARLMEVITQKGIPWKVVRTWPGGRDLERRLKQRGGHARICPICNPKQESK